MPLDPDTLVSQSGIAAAKQIEPLSRLGILTLRDLLRHIPFRWEDRTKFDSFPHQETEHPVCISGRVINFGSRQGNRTHVVEATIENDSPLSLGERIEVVWFGLRWIARELLAGQRLVLYGKARRRGRKICIEHPEFEILNEDDPEFGSHFNRIVGIHSATKGILPMQIRTLVSRTLDAVDQQKLTFHLPPEFNADPAPVAYREIHFPTSLAACESARRSFVLEEFFAMQMRIQAIRVSEASSTRPPHNFRGELADRLLDSLPFELTGAQQRAIAQISADLRSAKRMNRLLQGDVGSGKTFVALAAMLNVVETGRQAVIMAPTQILAEQHYLSFCSRLEPLGVRIGLRTAARDEQSLPLFSGKPEAPPQILVGTHALLSEKVGLEEVGLIVIDEQHKFGVAQRSSLSSRANAPDVLVMTATPIPRTLAMTVYGDLDVTILDELPKERGKIRSFLRDAGAMPKFLPWLISQLSAGRQAYVVCPAIDEGPNPDLKAAVSEHELWQKRLPDFSCALLHGRISPDEKERIMRQFRANEIQVLVSTTVIEVGIDIPNANVMVIENAERFGLAQLHQLRGRIGRGSHESYCVLMSGQDAAAKPRLEQFIATTDGFRIAELDFQIRGPGDIFGSSQSGMFALKIGDILKDFQWMPLARDAARRILLDDPLLKKAANRGFQVLLAEKVHFGGVS